MSDLRSKYPQAQAWTFVLSDTSPPQVKQVTGSAPWRSGATGVSKSKSRKVVERKTDEDMGTCCSSDSPSGLANKENAGCPEDIETVVDSVVGQASNARGVTEATAAKGSNSPKAPKSRQVMSSRDKLSVSTENRVENCWAPEEGCPSGAGVLDSTSLISPESSSVPSTTQGCEHPASLLDAGNQSGEETMLGPGESAKATKDRSAWLQDKLEKLGMDRSIKLDDLKLVRTHARVSFDPGKRTNGFLAFRHSQK